MRRLSRASSVLLALPFLLIPNACGFVGPIAGSIANPVSKGTTGIESVLASCGADCDEMADLFIADLHADPFLWNRDIRKRKRSAHVDVPRLRDGGVDLQVFSVPSSTPLARRSFATIHPTDDPRFYNPNERLPDYGGLKCTQPGADIDGTNELFKISRFEANTKRIAFAQAKDFCKASGGTAIMDDEDKRLFRQCSYKKIPQLAEPDAEGGENLFPILTRQDLKRLYDFNKERSLEKRAVGGLLSIEGVHWIQDSSEVSEEIKALKRAGFRMIGLTHKFTNSLGGSDEDCRKPPGLTALGVEVVREVLKQDLILDVAHLSADGILPGSQEMKTVMEILEEAPFRKRNPLPVVMSHGGVRLPYCDNPRNLPDRHVQALLDKQVPFGIIQWDQAYCVSKRPRETVVRRIVDAYAHSIELAGWEGATNALAIGADLDGAVRSPVDVTGFPYLLTRLAKSDWCRAKGKSSCDQAIRRIAGQNVYDVLWASLPEE